MAEESVTVCKLAVVRFPYTPKDDDLYSFRKPDDPKELPLKRGDEVQLLWDQPRNGVFLAIVDGIQGTVPETHIKITSTASFTAPAPKPSQPNNDPEKTSKLQSLKSPSVKAVQEFVENEKAVKRVIEEMYKGQSNNVSALKVVVERVMKPLYDATEKTEIVSSIQLNSMFPNTEVLYNMEKEVLRHWQTLVDSGETCVASLAKTFLEMLPFFKCYTDYINHFENALSSLDAELSKNKKFDTCITQAAKSVAQDNGFTWLTNALLTPTKRLSQFEKQLSDLVDSNNATPSLHEAHQKIKELESSVRNQVQALDNITKCYQVQRTIWGSSTPDKSKQLPKHSRKFIDDCELRIVTQDSKAHLFLFNDMIVLALHHRKKWKHYANVPLFNTSMRATQQKDIDALNASDDSKATKKKSTSKIVFNANGITVRSGTSQCYHLVFSSKEHQKWFDLINTTIKQHWCNSSREIGSIHSIHQLCKEYKLEELMSYVCDHEDSINARDALNRTPLHVACEAGSVGVVKFLLSRNAAPNEKDDSGRTPLDICKANENAAIAELLLKHTSLKRSSSRGKGFMLRSRLQKKAVSENSNSSPEERLQRAEKKLAHIQEKKQHHKQSLERLRAELEQLEQQQQQQQHSASSELDSSSPTSVEVSA